MEMRISDELNDIVKYSREEAMRTGHYGIGVDHLMLGIIRHAENDACRTLRGLGIDIEEMKGHIDGIISRESMVPYSEIDSIVFTRGAQNVFSLTLLEATRHGRTQAGAADLLLGLCRAKDHVCIEYLRSRELGYPSILAFMKDNGMLNGNEDGGGDESRDGSAPQEEEMAPAAPKESIEDFGLDLTKAAASGALDPVVGREDEIARVIEILGRRKKNNPMLIGEAGVGKSAIAEGIALRIASGEAPQAIAGKRIISLDIASVVAGTRYRGDFEKRLKGIIDTLQSSPDIILFIDEFHTLVGAGGAQGGLDAANMLKPALARGGIQCIGATTLNEFRKIVEKDAALDRRFQKVMVDPTGIDESIDILQQLKPRYEEFHGVHYTDAALEACVKLTDRYVTDKSLPDKAIDAMDEAGSAGRLRGGSKTGITITDDDIAAVISRTTGIPVAKVAESEGQKLMKMKDRLRRSVIGQDEAIDTVVRAIQRGRAGLKAPGRPVGTFLFFGPTGVGKTLLARRLAEYMFDSEDNLVRIDMSEYTEKISSSRLIGAPPGYVGYEEGGQLSEKVRRKPYCVILLDEIEKAHPDIYNLLLQVLDEGRLTDNNGHTVDFRNTIVIMTSNVGSRELDEYGSGLGFARAGKDLDAEKRNVLDKAIRKTFPPEFINRVDEKIYFRPLGRDQVSKIVDKEVDELCTRTAAAGYTLKVTEGARRLVAETGYDPSYGARPLGRAITRLIENPVAEFIITDRILGKKGTGSLRVALSRDKESTIVTRTD